MFAERLFQPLYHSLYVSRPVLSARPKLRSQIKLLQLVARIALKAVAGYLADIAHGSSRSLRSIAPLYLSNNGLPASQVELNASLNIPGRTRHPILFFKVCAASETSWKHSRRLQMSLKQCLRSCIFLQRSLNLGRRSCNDPDGRGQCSPAL